MSKPPFESNESSTTLPSAKKAETENEQSQIQLSDLPSEILAMIFGNLSTQEIVRARSVSKLFNGVIMDEFHSPCLNLEKQYLEIKTIQGKWTDDIWKYVAPERKREIFNISKKVINYTEAKRREDLLDDIHLEIIRAKIDLQSLTLYLSNLNLTRLPKALFTTEDLQAFWQSLKHLYLNNNKLTTLPAEMGGLKALQLLSLVHNKLTTLPAEMGRLKTLQRLYLNYNQLITLLTEIGELKNLKFLELSDNQLTTLPAELGGLKHLQRLYLWHNKLTEKTVRQFDQRFGEGWVRKTLQTQTKPNLVQAEESSDVNNMLRRSLRSW